MTIGQICKIAYDVAYTYGHTLLLKSLDASMGCRYCGNSGLARRGWGRGGRDPRGGVPNDLLAGGPDFEVTPLLYCVCCVHSVNY